MQAIGVDVSIMTTIYSSDTLEAIRHTLLTAQSEITHGTSRQEFKKDHILRLGRLIEDINNQIKEQHGHL